MSTIILLGGGKEEGNLQEFLVHKEVACLYSPVLAKAFDGDNPDPYNTGMLPQVVQLLVQWLYSQKLILHHFHDEPEECHYCTEHKLSEGRDLILLWILAKELEIHSLQDQVIRNLDAIHQDCGEKFLDQIDLVYAHGQTTCALQKYLVALCAHGYRSYQFVERNYSFPDQFLRDLVDYACARLHKNQKSYNLSDYFSNVQ